MKVLILDDVFGTSKFFKIITSKLWYRFFLYYKKLKLGSLVKKILEENGKNIEIEIITNSYRRIYSNKNIKTSFFSEYRTKLNREEFFKIRSKSVKTTKQILINLINNLNILKTFHIKNIPIAKLLEFNLATFFKGIFDEFQLLEKIIQCNKNNRIILFDYNINFLNFFKYLNKKFKNIEIYKDSILKKNFSMHKWFLTKYFFNLIRISLKNFFLEDKKSIFFFNKKKKSLIFIYSSSVQYESIDPIYDHLKKDKNLLLLYYVDKSFISLNKITEILKFLFQIKQVWQKNQDKIFNNLEYDALKLNEILNDFFNFELLCRIVRLFINLFHIKQYFKSFPPSIVILADELRAESRLYAKFCRLKSIPTIYITHGNIPHYPELSSKYDFKFIAVPGEYDKNYLIKRGELEKKIIVTGRPRYGDFYKGKIKKINEVKDMFKNEIYKFDPSKNTILFATSPVDYKSREIIFSMVVNSLKKLNLIDRLIIKIHPREDGVLYKNILQDLNINPVIIKDYDLFQLIISSDLYLSRISATILEALITGTPVILLDLVNLGSLYTGTYPFCEEDNLIKVKDKKSLIKEINGLITNKNHYLNYKKNLKLISDKYSFFDDKMSSIEIIINLIYKIIH